MRLKPNLSWTVLSAFIILAVIVLFPSCEKYAFIIETVNPADTVYFQSEIQPIFTDNCIDCHKGTRDPDLRDGYSYESLTTGGYVNQPAETSRLYLQVTSSSHTPYTLDTEKQLIFNWIQQGAQNN
jgi:hypothetical protein